jgi:hypothetical protein
VCWKPCSSCSSLYLLREEFISAPIHSLPLWFVIPVLHGRPSPAGPAHSEGWFGPLPCTRRIFNPKVLEAPPFARGEPFAPRVHPQATERGERSQEEDRPSRKKHPQVEKREDTVGSITMINSAMSSTLIGQSSHLSMGCNRS